MEIAKEVCPAFTITVDNRDLVNDIFRWSLMLDGRLDPGKGLWMWGNIGTGKSTMLQIVKSFCRLVRPKDAEGNRYSFAIVNASEICAAFSREGWPGIEGYLKSRRLAIDEVGRETLEVGHFGNVVNVIQQVLQSRYDNRHTHFTHVTSNITLEQIAERYGAHIWDRCKEMFNFVEFRGGTFRRAAK